MSENSEEKNENTEVDNTGATDKKADDGVKLDGLFAFKVGMSSVYDNDGNAVPVTVLKYENAFVSQVKTDEKDGYQAVQVAFVPKRANRTSKAEKNHLKGTPFENGTRFKKEIRQNLPDGVKVGQKVLIDSLSEGDTVRITSKSKGRGFSGTVRRWDFRGGPASHGSGFHRKPGSIGNRTFPGRVIPGKKMPGHFGDEYITTKNVKVVGVYPSENVLLLKGPVPGAQNTLVKILKV